MLDKRTGVHLHGGFWRTLPDDLMPLMSAAVTIMEVSSRQRAKCQTTGPVSSRPLDLCRATLLQRRRHVHLYKQCDKCFYLWLCARVFESYSQYSSLEVCIEEQLLFSWVQLVTKTLLTLQDTKKRERTCECPKYKSYISIYHNTSTCDWICSGCFNFSRIFTF